ncbi:MAG TPA: tol-pal system protein YbgF [Gammaproteobacteria bacterium]|nr:tol-pal system protein YbgF [Gammaproteobacteria bacterium]
MQAIFLRIVYVVSIVMGLSFATVAFSESAPVYDADTLQQQFENSNDQGENLQSPPPPEQERAFVPITPQSQQVIHPPSVTSAPTLTLSQRIAQIEQQIDNLQAAISSTQLDTLQKEIQSLRGQVEQLTQQLQQVQNQQKSMFSDLEKRLSQQSANMSKAVKTSSVDSNAADDSVMIHKSRKPANASNSTSNTSFSDKTSTDDQPNVAEEQQVYQVAYNLIKAKKYNEAINSLQNMLQKYPSGQFAANAHYWLGDLYNVMGKNDQALSEFTVVTRNYPDSSRVSDAQLKVGLIYASQLKWSEAKTAFKKVVNRYPGTASSRLAAEQLKQLKQAGH